VPARGIFSRNIRGARNTRHIAASTWPATFAGAEITGVVEQPYTEDDRRAEHDAERLGGPWKIPFRLPTWLATIIAARKARNIARPPP